MKALYRKYRPCRLADVVGQEQVTDILANCLKQGKISHAYLFIGPRGTGKTSVARIFAHEVNGFKYELEDDYVDIVEIDGASNRGIDNIRELREKATIAPTSGKYKIYIIDEVHMLTKEAFNALLKTLEEPPAHVIFIMATTDAYKVPITITSRAQTYTFRLADSKVMLDHIKSIAEKEKINITDDALEIIVKRGGGSFRDTLSLLDQISTLSDDTITKDLVIKSMGLPEDEKITKLLAEYTNGDSVKITTLIKDILSSGVKPETLAEEMIAQIIADPRQELLPLLAKLPDVKAPFPEAKLVVALASNRQALPDRYSSRVAISRSMSYDDTRADLSAANEGVLASVSCSGARPVSPSPRVAGATPQFANFRTPLRQDTDTTPSIGASDVTTKTTFDWDTFIEKVQALNDAVYSQLMKTLYEVRGDVLHIYPERKIVKTILSRENNKRILVDAAGGIRIEIHEFGEKPTNAKSDEILSKISDIMGGEVQNDRGGNPFEE
ncbi:MAG: DNA polymerase III subunit gamma/tau [Candidatus Saccharimonadaceae bacterium]|nr:DNA polymerase III subunit gamma/tau [Candidatus Saccharimonadaceae bacterium]